MTYEDDEFVRIEKESLWRKRQIEEDLGQPFYFKPKKEWVGLTDELVKQVCYDAFTFEPYVIARAVEAKLKELNDV